MAASTCSSTPVMRGKPTCQSARAPGGTRGRGGFASAAAWTSGPRAPVRPRPTTSPAVTLLAAAVLTAAHGPAATASAMEACSLSRTRTPLDCTDQHFDTRLRLEPNHDRPPKQPGSNRTRSSRPPPWSRSAPGQLRDSWRARNQVRPKPAGGTISGRTRRRVDDGRRVFSPGPQTCPRHPSLRLDPPAPTKAV
jgi:hypothetical protein